MEFIVFLFCLFCVFLPIFVCVFAYLCVMFRRAYAILSMVYAWIDNKKLFAKNMDIAKDLMATMQQNGVELPMVRMHIDTAWSHGRRHPA